MIIEPEKGGLIDRMNPQPHAPNRAPPRLRPARPGPRLAPKPAPARAPMPTPAPMPKSVAVAPVEVSGELTDRPSVVTLTWNREPARLHGLLWSLSHQTLPPLEVVVVDANTNARLKRQIAAVAVQFPLARVVEAPRHDFSLAWGFNVGIKASDERARYVITTGTDMLFGSNVIGLLSKMLCDRCMILSHCGFLVQGVDVSGDVHARWAQLCMRINPNPPVKISAGALIAAPRAWWHKVRGYDEVHHPFAFADSDMWMRAKLDKVSVGFMVWGKAQVLHTWHPTSPLVAKVGGSRPDANWGIVRNPQGWGILR